MDCKQCKWSTASLDKMQEYGPFCYDCLMVCFMSSLFLHSLHPTPVHFTDKTENFRQTWLNPAPSLSAMAISFWNYSLPELSHMMCVTQLQIKASFVPLYPLPYSSIEVVLSWVASLPLHP